jgi:PKD repeat protein
MKSIALLKILPWLLVAFLAGALMRDSAIAFNPFDSFATSMDVVTVQNGQSNSSVPPGCRYVILCDKNATPCPATTPTSTPTNTPISATATPTPDAASTATATAPSTPIPIVAKISAKPTSGKAPLLVEFSSRGSWGDIESYLWNFGDGATSTDQHPTHTYSSPGEYTVVLTISGLGGDLDSASLKISVTP